MKFRLPFLILVLAISEQCLSQITITFTVDMTGQTITPEGLHIAGQFALDNAISITQNWQPGAAGSQLTLTSGSIYTIHVTFPSTSAGKQLEFEFVRSNIWFGSEDYSEGNPGDLNAYIDNSCGVPDGSGGYNRIITIPSCGGQFTAVWNHCGTLTSLSPPTLIVSSDSEICPGKSIQLSATSNGNVVWSPATGLSCSTCDNPLASPLGSTLYTVNSSMGTCSVTDSVLIIVDTSSLSAGADQYITPGASVQLNANGFLTYAWQPTAGLSCSTCSSPIASPTATTSYVVLATSANGCKSSDTVTVYVSKSFCEGIFFPKAFTPNGDGINDKFGPLTLNTINFPFKLFRIYNRWGELVFETKEFTHKWDGKFHNVDQPIGNYIYFLLLDCNGTSTVIKGNLTLVR
jgi:gliding motility-associated-like protein